MKIVLLVLLLIPIFIFQLFIISETIDYVRNSKKRSTAGTHTYRYNNYSYNKSSKKQLQRTSVRTVR